MSASVKLTSGQLRSVAAFLDAMTEASRDTGVQLCVYDRDHVQVDGAALQINWSDEDGYFIDEQVGS